MNAVLSAKTQTLLLKLRHSMEQKTDFSFGTLGICAVILLMKTCQRFICFWHPQHLGSARHMAQWGQIDLLKSSLLLWNASEIEFLKKHISDSTQLSVYLESCRRELQKLQQTVLWSTGTILKCLRQLDI